MVTWNQGINSGGFLAGIGTNNDNAPKASDADTALAYIRDNNDRERSGQNNLGLQAVLGATNVLQGLKQYDEQQTAQAFQKDYASAMQSGDRQQVRDLMTKYPGQMEKIQSGMKWADDDQRSTVGNLAASARLASSSPELMGAWLKNNAADLQRVGLSPQDIAQTYQQNPQQFSEFADHLGMAALGPEQYYSLQDKALSRQQAGQIAQGNLNLGQQRLQQQAAYQQGQLNQGQQQLNLTAQKNQADNANKRFELLLKSKDNSAKSQANMQSSVQKMQDYVGAHQSNVNNVSGMLDTVNQVKSIPADVFDRVFGFGGTINSSIPGTESADAWAKIEQMQSQARLMGVIGMKGTGPVSDSEGQAAARAFMSINQNMSPKAARNAVDNWQKVLQRQTAYLQKQQPTIDNYRQKIESFNAQQSGGSSSPNVGHVEGGYTFIGGDPGNPNSWRKN